MSPMDLMFGTLVLNRRRSRCARANRPQHRHFRGEAFDVWAVADGDQHNTGFEIKTRLCPRQ
jgi:hypothetical protein